MTQTKQSSKKSDFPSGLSQPALRALNGVQVLHS